MDVQCVQQDSHAPGQVVLQTMLPNTQDRPAALAKQLIGFPVSRYVPAKFFSPELRAAPWPRTVPRARMPEASVQENRHPLFGKNEIGIGRELQGRRAC